MLAVKQQVCKGPTYYAVSVVVKKESNTQKHSAYFEPRVHLYQLIFVQRDSVLTPMPLAMLICPMATVANNCCIDKRRGLKTNKPPEVVAGELVLVQSYPSTYSAAAWGKVVKGVK